jgi:putative inorganic carbon (HCO3(-)) transporter
VNTLIGRAAARVPDSQVLFLYEAVAAAAMMAALAAVQRPTEVLVGLVVLSAVIVVLLRTDLAILLVVASAPVELAVTTTIGGLSLTKIAGGLCFASFALYALRSREEIYVDRSQVLVLVILAAAMLSTLQARELSAALSTTLRYAAFALFFIVVTQFARDHRLQRRIAWVMTASAAVIAGVALNAYLKGEVLVATPILDTNPNDFAFILGTTLPFGFWLLRSRPYRLLTLAMIGVISAAILLSLSRGAMLGIAAGIVFLLFTDRRRTRIVLGAGAIALVAGLLVVRADPAKFERALFRKEVVAGHNVTTRLEAWNAASKLAADHPLLGIGPGNFRSYYYEATGNPPGTEILAVVHDAYLDVAAELGFVAAVAFLLYLVLAFARLTGAIRAGAGPPDFAQTVRISLVIGAVSAIFISEQYFLPFWLLGGLATALWQEASAKEGHARSIGGPANG